MKLTKADLAVLKDKFDVNDKYIPQIKEAIRRSTYTFGEKKISADEAVELLGRDNFLSGIVRSAFHYSAVRIVQNGTKAVYFDSSVIHKT